MNAVEYVSKPVKIQAMRWQGEDARFAAEQIVAWVKANGGDARYEPGDDRCPAQLVVRSGCGKFSEWVPAPPGWYIVKGDATFSSGVNDRDEPVGASVLDFRPYDPETFEQRWVVSG